MAAYEDLTGRRFGRLTVLYRDLDYVSLKGKRSKVVRCRCDCGVEVKARASALKHGEMVSCGCYKAEMMKERMREIGKRRWEKRT